MSREPATLIILAGGESKRMGFPKHRLHIDGVDVLSHLRRRLGHLLDEILVAGRDLTDIPQGLRDTEDRYVIRSPLVGIHAGLADARTDVGLVIACDMPHVEPTLVEYILASAQDHDVAVPIVRDYYEPLCAAYRKACIRPIAEMLSAWDLKVSNLYQRVATRTLPQKEILLCDPGLRSFVNLNAERHLEGAS